MAGTAAGKAQMNRAMAKRFTYRPVGIFSSTPVEQGDEERVNRDLSSVRTKITCTVRHAAGTRGRKQLDP
jgi:hypothetical protein